MSSNLKFYLGTPFTPNNIVSLDDLFVGNGTQTTFTLANKSISDLGESIQVGNTIYYSYNGGFTTNAASGTFTLATAPGIGAQVTAPGMEQVVIAAFDQPTVLGVVNPQTAYKDIYLVDPLSINNYKYENLPTYPGIQVSVVQTISGTVAQTSWTSLASADASGNALTYGATGAPLYLPPLDGFATLLTSVSSTAPILTISSSASSGLFWPGNYILINPGASSQEILHVIAIWGSNQLVLDPTGVTYPHYSGELVFACGWKAWLQLNIPTNANNNTPVNMYNLALQKLCAIRARP